MAFRLAQISKAGTTRRSSLPEAPGPTTGASGGDILTNVKAASAALCRPAGWIALWRTIGTLSVLNRLVRA